MKNIAIKEKCFDPVHDSQAVFRELMNALAMPGKVKHINNKEPEHMPDGFYATEFSIVMTLFDRAVCYSLAKRYSAEKEIYIKIHTQAEHSSADLADFVFFDGYSFDGDFVKLKRGSLPEPEKSATALIRVNRLSESYGPECLKLKGPGIETENTLYLSGLDEKYIHFFQELNSEYPLGVDIFFYTDSGDIAALARTTITEVMSWDM